MKSWWPPRAALAGMFALALAIVALVLGGEPLQAANGQPIENPHGSFRGECALCHSSSDWRTLRLSKRFDHARYGFALESAHASAACTSCHQSLDFSRAQTACASCHADPHRGEMGTECARCHGARSFTDRAPMVRAHELTRLPLNGAHATAACEECHRPAAQGQLQFVGTAAECRACHESDYRATRNPDHAAQGFPLDCRGCHTSQTWTSATFDHSRTRFPLSGAHVTQACASCHGNGGDFAAADPACASCHQAQYDSATPGHAAAGFPASQCATCHNTTSFSGGTFDHGATRFGLTGAHASTACLSCHADGVYHDKPRDCVSCHSAQYGSAVPNHTAAGFAASACASCHGTVVWSGARFDHNATAFALTGAHQTVSCNSCHADGVFDGKPTACIACHASDYSGATPDHAASGFAAAQCLTCHNTTTFAGAVFNHDTQTSFTLTGAHRAVNCQSCHSDGVYDGKPTACFACHSSDYSSATVNHTAAGFASGACATCHNTTRWTGTTYNHNATSFPLTGAHTTTACNSCHGDGVFNNHPTDCASCHQADYDHATPDHRAAGFSTNCVRCHGTTTFAGAVFDHNLNTSFPLTGAHVAQPCAMCHSDGVYAGRSTACASCHMSDYSAATPNHAQAGFAASVCATCHNTTTFTGATFNHDTQTSFTLTGAHRTVNCQSCHSDGVYDGKPTACFACHSSDYSGASLNHTAAGFASGACATCHTTTAWTGATYNHNATSFPLTGAHTSATCNSCHSNGVFNNHAMDCASCHMADYNAAQPPHASSGFAASACATCHTTTTFAGAVFNHDTQTSFALTGAHRVVTCQSCHSDGVYDGKPTACFACHSSDYSGASLNHTAAGFASGACATCHTTTAWTGATYNHNATSFPLTGAHTSATCNSCHSNGVFNNHAMDCASCHMADYDAAQPPHASSGFAASACATCHTTTTFAGAVFNHSTTAFPLTGAHQAVSCNSCHSDGVYDGKPTACYSCHASDYSAAVPTHTNTTFPTNACGTCHTTTAWAGATFNHSLTSFPLTGAHVTTTCQSCHADGVYDGKPTACLSCHQSDWNSTAPPHATAAGFNSAQCATCHTTTAWTGGKFTAHDGSYFKIYSGKHKSRWSNDCSSCHTSAANYTSFTCIACHEHSSATEVAGHHGGVSGYTYNATSCYGCHRNV